MNTVLLFPSYCHHPTDDFKDEWTLLCCVYTYSFKCSGPVRKTGPGKAITEEDIALTTRQIWFHQMQQQLPRSSALFLRNYLVRPLLGIKWFIFRSFTLDCLPKASVGKDECCRYWLNQNHNTQSIRQTKGLYSFCITTSLHLTSNTRVNDKL